VVYAPPSREAEAIQQALLPLQAQRFPTPEAAQEALAVVAKRWQDHQGAASPLTEHPRYAGKGRPTPRTPRTAIAWHLQAHVRPADEAMGHPQQVQAWVVLGPPISAGARRAPEGIAADTRPARVAGGGRWRQAPRGCGAAGCVTPPRRRDGLLRVMPPAWRGSSVTPRRRRQP
jgi:hypothetical protein